MEQWKGVLITLAIVVVALVIYNKWIAAKV